MSGRFDLLFVYGSLLRGQPQEGYLLHLPAAPATCPGRLVRLPAGYPALIPEPDAGPVLGEAVRFSDPGLLTLLDLYEDVAGGLYTRQRVPITVKGRTLDAWAWVTTADLARRRGWHPLKTRDWREVAPRPNTPER